MSFQTEQWLDIACVGVSRVWKVDWSSLYSELTQIETSQMGSNPAYLCQLFCCLLSIPQMYKINRIGGFVYYNVSFLCLKISFCWLILCLWLHINRFIIQMVFAQLAKPNKHIHIYIYIYIPPKNNLIGQNVLYLICMYLYTWSEVMETTAVPVLNLPAWNGLFSCPVVMLVPAFFLKL